MNLGLSSVHTSDKLRSIFIPTTRIRSPNDGHNWLLPGHCIGKVTADRVIRTRSKQNYNAKIGFETRRENQYFGRQNNSMCQPPLYSTPLGTNTNSRTLSPIASIPVGTKTLEPTPLTLPMDLTEQNGKAHVPGYPDPEKSSSDSSAKKSNYSNDSNSSKLIKKKSNKKKKCRKHKKQESPDSLSIHSYSSDDSDYRRKRPKKRAIGKWIR